MRKIIGTKLKAINIERVIATISMNFEERLRVVSTTRVLEWTVWFRVTSELFFLYVKINFFTESLRKKNKNRSVLIFSMVINFIKRSIFYLRHWFHYKVFSLVHTYCDFRFIK